MRCCFFLTPVDAWFTRPTRPHNVLRLRLPTDAAQRMRSIAAASL